MPKLIAIHSVEYMNAKNKRDYAKPGHMFAVADEATADKLKSIKAARDPNESELALEAMKEGKAAPKTAPKTVTKPSGSGAPAGGAPAGGAAATGAAATGAKSGDDVI